MPIALGNTAEHPLYMCTAFSLNCNVRLSSLAILANLVLDNEMYLSVTGFYVCSSKKCYPKNSIVFPKNGATIAQRQPSAG